jgi:hypothetical protein
MSGGVRSVMKTVIGRCRRGFAQDRPEVGWSVINTAMADRTEIEGPTARASSGAACGFGSGAWLFFFRCRAVRELGVLSG